MRRALYYTCKQPLPPCGIGAPCWFTTSKNIAVVVVGVKLQNFQAFVFPMPISTSLTHASFLFAETQAPMAPEMKECVLHKFMIFQLNRIQGPPQQSE